MTKRLTLCLLGCCTMAATAMAQDIPNDSVKTPEYIDPMEIYVPEPSLMKYVPVQGESAARRQARMRAAADLPDHWNNAETRYFPPVFNQAGGSCTFACRLGYVFTHEMNALRDTDGSLAENQYPANYMWLLMSAGYHWLRGEIMQYVGVPNVVDYGGRTYSNFFGYQEASDGDFGWMTGYDRWTRAINNRMHAPTSTPMTLESEEGRMAAKAWLYNHAGDNDYKAGGLIAIDVACGTNTRRPIPKTPANDAAQVTGMEYMHLWGPNMGDHSVTIVGYDDRIEFDLDGNGIAGEKDKDEVGAWIIANSWGYWSNAGFVYCPYKNAVRGHNQETGEILGGYLGGSMYHMRKNFRTLRHIKLKMDYTHRSELYLQLGVSTDLNATEPESVIDMHHFRYTGDGQGGNADPAPEVPMLGRWQGTLNKAPMEFAYDVTDLSARFDPNRPLKYFFIINRKKDTSLGSGHIYEASIVDTEYDGGGIESAFDLGGKRFNITPEGKRIILSTIVYGAGYYPVNNLMFSDGTLTWDLPDNSGHRVASYNVYRDGTLLDNTAGLSYTVEGGREYGVSAVYEDGNESARATAMATVEQNDVAASIEEAGFAIPKVFDNHYKECTIEYYIKPSRVADWNNQAGPGWGTFLIHSNADATLSCGWDAGTRINTSDKLSLNTWQHMAIVVKDHTMTLYKNAKAIGTISSDKYSGLGGFGDLLFRYANAGEWQNAQYDEIRIWNYARTEKQLKGSNGIMSKKQEFYGDVLPQGLLAYYKGDTFMDENGVYYMRECVSGNHAPIYGIKANPETASDLELENTNLPASLAIDTPAEVFAGQPVTLTATRSDRLNSISWSIPACGIADKHITAPTITFPEAGTYEVTVKGITYQNKEYTDTLQLEVKEAIEPDAAFTISTPVISCGEQLSMQADKFVNGHGYEWTLTGADVEKVYGAKAGAMYDANGEYTITLTVTSADGRTAETSQTVQVNTVAPKADFFLNEPIVMKETPVTLNSTSRFAPTSLEWTLDGQAQKTTVTPGLPVQQWTPKYPGRYDITLKAANSVGEDAITKKNALIVLNAESGSGLNFGQGGAQVAIPNDKNLGTFTIDFWANPSSLNSSCWGIGQDESTMLIKVNAKGVMTLYIKGASYSSDEGFVEAGMWNHYAVSRRKIGTAATVEFMRNGEVVKTITQAVSSTINAADMPTIYIGTDKAPITGSIDEFRIWTNYQMKNLPEYCNQPLENPETYSTLMVYYDFNQTGGDVIDRTGNGRTGKRIGFGPDGDAWGLSKGVFSLYLGDKLDDEIVTGVDEVISTEPVTAGRSGVYTISGQYVGKTVQGLPAGLYIVDGKKMVIK